MELQEVLPAPAIADAGQEGMKLRRASVACRRCRRLRTKCVTQNGKAPCDGCRRAGEQFSSSCFFPTRGHSHFDRGYRVEKAHKRKDADTTRDNIVTVDLGEHGNVTVSAAATEKGMPIGPAFPTPSSSPSLSGTARQHHQSVLPPQREVIEGCTTMWTCVFQVGFISKRLFLEKLLRDVSSIPLFLLLSILSVSCRFTPCLIRRYGSSQAATEYFMHQASLLVPDCMYDPTLENVQAFLLLALSQWGHGDKVRSSTHMGIAVRMAGLLRLHREETYRLSDNATTEDIVKAEIARRTFWVLETEGNLHTSHASPVPFSLDDITALLPCEESDFSFGRLPAARAAMPGTKAAQLHPELVSLSSRSIFATLLQAHSLWGRVARSAQPADDIIRIATSGRPAWDPDSSYAKMCRELRDWEKGIPDNHRWSVWNMRGHTAEHVHLAYLSVVMVIRLANIVVRRDFLDIMVSNVSNQIQDGSPDKFWETAADELYQNVEGLMEPIEWFMSTRAEAEGFSAILLFSLYTCGTLYLQLIRTPHLCPKLARAATPKLAQCLQMLSEFQGTWPLASKWLASLTKAASSVQQRSTAGATMQDMSLQDGSSTVIPNVDENSIGWSMPASLEMLTAAAESAARVSTPPPRAFNEIKTTGMVEALLNEPSDTVSDNAGGSTSFEHELAEFLGIGSYGMMDVWPPLDDSLRSGSE